MVHPGNQSRLMNPAPIGANVNNMVGMSNQQQHMSSNNNMQRSPAPSFVSNAGVPQRQPTFQQPSLVAISNPGSLHQVSSSSQQYSTIPKQPLPVVVGTQAAVIAAQSVHPQSASMPSNASASSISGYSQVPEQVGLIYYCCIINLYINL